MRYNLQKGFKSNNGQVEIVDEDKLCFIVRNISKGASGLRTISKALLDEYVEYFETKKNPTYASAREDLSGTSEIDKFEYGYTSTLSTMAKMVLGEELSDHDKVLAVKLKTSIDLIELPLQVIFYGAPGTGKSHQTDLLVENDRENKFHQRTTFHPDSDYSSFVGCYKPSKENGELTYKFIPQAFLNVYVAAWKNLGEPYYLIIEEINRGNCAQIFGDIFQLLDRRDDGFSKYHISSDTDIESYLRDEAFKGLSAEELPVIPSINTEQILRGKIMQLPSNLHIYATMNTSDQSLFPIDSAFKRRWEWEYKPIEQPKDAQFCDWKIVTDDNAAYDWWNFLTEVNNRIFDTTHSEDKKMGYWFTKADAQKRISQKKFIGKVLFYLWNDVFKDYARTENTIFKVSKDAEKKETEEYTFTDFFCSDGVTERIHRLMFTLGIKREQWIDDDSNEEDGEDLNELQRKAIASKYSYILNGERFSGIGKVIIFIVNKLGENFTFDEIADTFNRIVKKTYKNESAIKAQLPSELNPDENGRNRWYVNPFKDKDGKQFSLISLWPDSYFKRIKEWVEFYPEIFPNGFEQVQNTNSID